ncbi:MAG: PHP domain-containing protein [Armatimonadota bacterium]
MAVERALFSRCDLHVHTHLSPCGWDEMTPEAIIQAAERMGLEHISITDHIHPSINPAIVHQLREEFSRIDTKVRINISCEADILSVRESVIGPELIAGTDYIMAAANHFGAPWVSKPKSSSKCDVARHFLDMFTYAAGLPYVSVIAHPLYVMPDTYDPLAPAELTEAELIPAIEVAAKNNVAVEISRRALAPEQRPFLVSFYRLCKEAGLKFSIGNDAHQLKDVGQTCLVEPIVRELGLTDEDIWLPCSRTSW